MHVSRLLPLALLAHTAKGQASCPDGIGNDTDILEVRGGVHRMDGPSGHSRHRALLDRRATGQTFAPVSTQNNQCLDVAGNNLNSGSKLQLWNCAGTANQQWRIEGPLFQTGNDMCLDLPNGWVYNGAKLQVWKCDGQNDHQHWSQVGSSLAYQGGDYCLDVTSGWFNNGNQLQLWTCYPGSANQAFNFAGSTIASSGSSTATTDFYGYKAVSLGAFVAKNPACAPYKDALQAAGSDQGINPTFLGAIAMVESGCNPYPAGPNGQYGPFQFMSDQAWNFYGGTGKDRTNFWDAAYGAARYFHALLVQDNGNLWQAMRDWNGPIGQGGDPAYQSNVGTYMSGG
jgi:hypothetical protein